MINIPEEILKALPRNKLVIFVGSGFSKPLGFNDWSGLAKVAISEYAKTNSDVKHLQYCLENKLLSEILIFDALKDIDKNKIIEIIKADNNKSIAPDKLGNHKKLWQISDRIITTNYDKAIETVKPNTSIEVISHNHLYELVKSLSKDSWLFHIHGMIDNTSDCIIFSDSYYQLYQKKHPAIEQLKSIVLHNTILFMGFSMKDKYVAKLFDDLNLIFGDTLSSGHFILLEESETLNNRHLTKIPIDSYSQIPEFLDQLIKSKELQLQSPVPITRYLRRRCRTFKPSSDEFNSVMIELRNETFNKNNIDNFKKRINNLKDYENILALAALYENESEIEKMKDVLESACFEGEEEMTRQLYLALAFEKLDWAIKAIQILDKIIANPNVEAEMALCAKFNRSVCAEKMLRYDEVFFEQLISNTTTLKFTKERIKDKAISNHLIVCKQRKMEFKYENELKESTEYEIQTSEKSQSKTLINYLTNK
ncbi:MAG TPA: SIR2 family protein, partial [Bacteroidia bacterium]|nr:SIR2 family protein [Bacteroidia bacterium]